MSPRIPAVVTLALLAGLPAAAQTVTSTPIPGVPPAAPVPVPDSQPMLAPIVIVPQARRHWVPAPQRAVQLDTVNVKVAIDGQIAVTTLELALKNTASFVQRAELVIPVPEGVTVRSMEYDGAGAEPFAKLLPKDEARRIYNSIVASMRDPALLEFAGYNLIRTSVFPIPAGGTQKLKIVYEQLATVDSNRLDYWLPRSDSFAASGGGTNWTISASVKSDRPIATIYSPSHELAIERVSPKEVNVRATAPNTAGAFRLSIINEKSSEGGMTSSVMAFPDPKVGDGTGGYFMMIVSPPAALPADAKKQTRDVTMIIDRSGSMRGQKIEQARVAAEQVVEGLNEGESFNIIDFSDSINSFSDKPVVKNKESLAKARAYIRGIQANGGTNIHDVLVEALRKAPAEGALPLVLFLTDGLPTVGVTGEVPIRDAVKAGNSFKRRIFSFGVGFDVNSPLLTNIARTSRGATTFVLPDENVEQKVSQVFRRLDGPILSSPKVIFLDDKGEAATTLAREILPAEMPDVFDGDQVVILGQYTSAKPVRVRIDGSYLGKPQEFTFSLDTATATVKNSFVPRLWATRKIASMIDSVRQLGAGATPPITDPASDTRTKELVDEIIRLSTTYGILTEYTSFIAVEPGSQEHLGRVYDRTSNNGVWMLSATREMRDRAASKLQTEAIQKRSGNEGASKDVQVEEHLKQAAAPSAANTQYRYTAAGKQEEVRYNGVQQIADQTVFYRNSRWIDARLLAVEDKAPDRTVEFGTPEFDALVDQLVAEGRQGLLANSGEIYILVNNQSVLVKMPTQTN